MKDTKIIKGYCKRTRQNFGLEIKQFGSEWKVVNFINISAEEASLITSEIRQSSFKTNDNLLPCSRCGKRVVSGCSCAPRSFSCRAGVYNYQCIYCNQMEIDYSASVLSGGYKEGDVIKLSQGQEVTIHAAGGGELSKIIVGVGWDPARSGSNMDVDSSVIVAGSDSYETIYFGDLEHPSGCVIHHGDNLTGEDRGQDDDENITVYLDKVPSNRDRLIFVLNIYQCVARNQQLGDVRNMYIRLYDPDAGRPIIEYNVTGNLRSNTALIIGMAFRKNGSWSFRAIGRGSNAASVQELAREVKDLR